MSPRAIGREEFSVRAVCVSIPVVVDEPSGVPPVEGRIKIVKASQSLLSWMSPRATVPPFDAVHLAEVSIPVVVDEPSGVCAAATPCASSATSQSLLSWMSPRAKHGLPIVGAIVPVSIPVVVDEPSGGPLTVKSTSLCSRVSIPVVVDEPSGVERVTGRRGADEMSQSLLSWMSPRALRKNELVILSRRESQSLLSWMSPRADGVDGRG